MIHFEKVVSNIMKTKGQLISTLRSRLKEVTADSMYPNRYLWSEIQSAFFVLLKRESYSKSTLYQMSELWQNICMPMVPVSSILCDCLTLKTPCVLYRSAFKIPKGSEDAEGITYRFLSSPDNSVHLTIVSPFTFQVKSNLRFNQGKYAFVHDGYLWTNQSYPYLLFSAIFSDDISAFKCSEQPVTDGNENKNKCKSRLDEVSSIPGHLELATLDLAFERIGRLVNKMTDNIVNSSESQREISN